MKKAIFAVLALALTLGVFQNSWAAGRTSTSLNNESIMLSNISQPNTGVPLGTVIIWSRNGMPQDAENWRVCNGQSLAGTELCKQSGQCVAPNYQGFFLRGVGGKSAALGEAQAEAVYLPESSGTTMEIKGITNGDYTYQDTVPYTHDDTAGYSFEYRTADFIPRSSSKWHGNDCYGTWCYQYNFAGSGIGLGDGMEVPIKILSPAQETRPINKSVYYLIKVN